jgi:tetratricopeptide (TPR) repeat protein
MNTFAKNCCFAFLCVAIHVLAGCNPAAEMQEDGDPLNEARQLASKGKWEESLDKHIWIHNHVLEERPSYYGVRLSYALSEWVKLGEKYPKALQALTEIRDAKTEQLLGSERNRNLFHDVAAINEALGQSFMTATLFEELDKSSPGFAENVYTLADEALVRERKYDLARKYLGEPLARLKEAHERLNRGLDYAKTSRVEAASRRAHETIFVGEAVRIIVIVKNTDGIESAKLLQAEAIKILDDPRIQSALLAE